MRVTTSKLLSLANITLHIVGKIIRKKLKTDDNIKQAEINFMLDLRTLISKTLIDAKTGVRARMRRRRDTYRTGRLKTGFGQIISTVRVSFCRQLNCRSNRITKKTHRHCLFPRHRNNKDAIRNKNVWWPELQKAI